MLQGVTPYHPSLYIQVENSALRARVEGAIATTEEELRLLPDRVIKQASSQLHDSQTGGGNVTSDCHVTSSNRYLV